MKKEMLMALDQYLAGAGYLFFSEEGGELVAHRRIYLNRIEKEGVVLEMMPPTTVREAIGMMKPLDDDTKKCPIVTEDQVVVSKQEEKGDFCLVCTSRHEDAWRCYFSGGD